MVTSLALVEEVALVLNPLPNLRSFAVLVCVCVCVFVRESSFCSFSVACYLLVAHQAIA